jgi:GNAT superfamily N-acetyltransferase
VTYAAAQEQYTEIAFRALDVDAANLALGHETFEACGATFVRNRAYPLIYDANHVAAISASTPEEIDRLLARVEREYDHTAHREFGIDFRTPPAFVARLLLEGFDRRDSLVMVLNGELRARPPDIEIRRVQTEDDWRDYAALRELDWREHERRIKKAPEPAVGESLYSVARLKQPPVQYWFACLKGRPLAYFNSWAGIDGVGQVEDLFTHPKFRHQGLATALIHHCVRNAGTTGPALSLSSLTPRIRRNRCTPPWASGPSLCTRITSRGFQRHSAPGNFRARRRDASS